MIALGRRAANTLTETTGERTRKQHNRDNRRKDAQHNGDNGEGPGPAGGQVEASRDIATRAISRGPEVRRLGA